MTNSITITLAQCNAIQGDIQTNLARIIQISQQHTDSDIIVFPELALTGYPLEDLLLRPEIHDRVDSALQTLCQKKFNNTIIIGHPRRDIENRLFNSASVINQGKITTHYDKQCLPNYSVFDEKRYFQKGTSTTIFEYKGVKFGLLICEDLWEPKPIADCKTQGADSIIALNASPFHIDKHQERLSNLRQRTHETGLPIIYVNTVGGQDELVFDGGSCVINHKGELCLQLPEFEESTQTIKVNNNDKLTFEKQTIAPPLSTDALIYNALVLATRDYIEKNNINGVLIGVSGGIDSALTLAIAVDAIGVEKVHAVTMPSEFTSTTSIDAALNLINNLKVQHSDIPITTVVNSFIDSLSADFAGRAKDLTEENIQARTRGTLLMALSNKFGKIVLTTGNKSEMAVGYSTLYGDMAGGYAVLKDVLKTKVYELSNYRNQISPVIPQIIIDRPPSAELRADQTDQDSLPAYEILDQIILRYVQHNESVTDIIATGLDADTVKQCIRLIDNNEFKRRQAPPGVRITSRAFGRDWRYPITSAFNKDL